VIRGISTKRHAGNSALFHVHVFAHLRAQIPKASTASTHTNSKTWLVCLAISRTTVTLIPCFPTEDQLFLPSPPFDSISSVHYSPTDPDHLLVSSWDTVRCFHTSNFTSELYSFTRLFDSTKSARRGARTANKRLNSTIEQPCWLVAFRMACMCTVGG
jgi:hypothetical protein